jgi:hypothetical protein
LTYDEFERKIESEQLKNLWSKYNDYYGEFQIPYRIFYDFHPNRLPVLWRILLTQAGIYNIIINVSKCDEKEITSLIKEKFIKKLTKHSDN